LFGNNCYSNSFGYDCYNNSFGNNCYSNSFNDYLQSRLIDKNKVSITLNDEYYDDGTGQLVPIKHPDLSTQPNILPYKFMGQYVYEQLIPVDAGLIEDNSLYKINWSNYNVDKPLILEGYEIIYGLIRTPDLKEYYTSKINNVKSIAYQGFEYDGISSYDSTTIEVSRGAELEGITTINKVYLKIVYTSMPEDSSYYGYNNY
jgi:hypothetical protein